jgi:hypothetical protein
VGRAQHLTNPWPRTTAAFICDWTPRIGGIAVQRYRRARRAFVGTALAFVVWLTDLLIGRKVTAASQVALGLALLLALTAGVLLASSCRAMSRHLHTNVKLRNFPPFDEAQFQQWCERRGVNYGA